MDIWMFGILAILAGLGLLAKIFLWRASMKRLGVIVFGIAAILAGLGLLAMALPVKSVVPAQNLHQNDDGGVSLINIGGSEG